MVQDLEVPRRQLVTLKQAARYTASSEKTIRRRIADGSIPAYRLGPRQLRIDLNDVEAALRLIPTVAGRHE